MSGEPGSRPTNAPGATPSATCGGVRVTGVSELVLEVVDLAASEAF